jgi:hypothetical protein
MMAMGRTTAPTPEEAALILAAVARETRSYTDPRAEYPLAKAARDARLAGALRRRATRGTCGTCGTEEE